MKTVKLSFYMLKNEYGKVRRSTWHMSEEEALSLDPNAVAIEYGSITIERPETDEERSRCIFERSTGYHSRS
jgi:hypothetical protein